MTACESTALKRLGLETVRAVCATGTARLSHGTRPWPCAAGCRVSRRRPGIHGTILSQVQYTLHSGHFYFRRRSRARRTRAKRSEFFTIMRARMVWGFRLARRMDIVSRPPLKMRSTDTAEPEGRQLKITETDRVKLTWDRENVSGHPS
jgi:hypothetical protein